MNKNLTFGLGAVGKTSLNLFCSLAGHLISACMTLLITPFLIDRLGMELYGLYPIVLEMSAFAGIIFSIVNSTSGRYISIEAERGNFDVASKYFSVTFFANLAIGVLMLIPISAVVVFEPNFLKIPNASLNDVRIFTSLVFASVLTDAAASAFGSVYYFTNRLDVKAAQQLTAVIVKAVSLVALFAFSEASLTTVGIAILISTTVSAIIQILIFEKAGSSIRLSIFDLSLNALRRLVSSGLWYSANRAAAFLTCGSFLLLTNAFFPAASGIYSVAFVAVNALTGVITVISGVFIPTSARHYARGEQKRLCDLLVCSQKTVGFFAAVAFAVFVAFCDEFYRLWLGNAPDKVMIVLSFILAIPVLSLACATPIVNVGMVIDRTKKLSLIFLGFGLLTSATALAAISHTNVDVFGVAAISSLAQTLWYAIAPPIFASKVLGCSPKKFWFPTFRTFLSAFAALGACLALNVFFKINLWIELVIIAALSAAISATIAFFGIFKSFKRSTR